MPSSSQPYPAFLSSNWFHAPALTETKDAMVDGTTMPGTTQKSPPLTLRANTHTLQATELPAPASTLLAQANTTMPPRLTLLPTHLPSKLLSQNNQFQLPLKLTPPPSNLTPQESLPVLPAEPTLTTQLSPSDMVLQAPPPITLSETHGEPHGAKADTSGSVKLPVLASVVSTNMLLIPPSRHEQAIIKITRFLSC